MQKNGQKWAKTTNSIPYFADCKIRKPPINGGFE